MNLIDAALERARAAVGQPPCLAPDGRPRPVQVVIGDPQAPVERFFQILAHHKLLDPDGRLASGALLISIGDHFDYKQEPLDLASAARSGLEILSWLASHPPDQVVVIAGNHDLARVGELAGFDDASFRRVQEEATEVYHLLVRAKTGTPLPEAEDREKALLERFPALPSAEFVARDMSAFTVAQRELVTTLLRTGRMRLAWAQRNDQLVLHAGVTSRDLRAAGLASSEHGDARAIAALLNDALDAAVAGWDGTTPLTLPHELHTPGGDGREGGGIVYHRPKIFRDDRSEFEGPLRRRFDPRHAPAGLTQIVGHIQDRKCRDQLAAWADKAPSRVGVLRHLFVESTPGGSGRYAHDAAACRPTADEALFLFVDGAMTEAAPEAFELLDLATSTAFVPG